MKQYSSFDRVRVMETDTILKNGASLKSQMNRRTYANRLKTFFVLPFILVIFSVNAQNESVTTLFKGNKKINIGYYAALESKFSKMDDGLGLHLGGKIGVILNKRFSIGGAGYGLLPTAKTSFDCPIPGHEIEKNNNYWSGGYGGLFFEYINSSDKLLYFTANTLIGGGRITYKNINSFFTDNNNYFIDKRNSEHPSSVIFILEPGVAVNLNMTKSFIMSLGVSYRYVPNFKLMYEEELVPKTFFNGLSANLVFKFVGF